MIITLFQTKGGAGKSTITTALASYFHTEGRSVGIIDSDPQPTTYRWSQKRSSKGNLINMPVGYAETPEEIRSAKRLLKSLDMIFIDSPGHDSEMSRVSGKEADLLIVPLRSSPKDMDAFFNEGLAAIRKLNKPYYVVVNAVKKGSSGGRAVQGILKKNEIPYFNTILHNYVAHEYADVEGETAYSLDKTTHPAYDTRCLALELMKCQEAV